jgi:hypothetical protein
MKKKGQEMRNQRARSQTNNDATDLVTEPTLDQATIALLAYFYWEARGCPHDSAQEDWLAAEAELRNRLLPAVPTDEPSLKVQRATVT